MRFLAIIFIIINTISIFGQKESFFWYFGDRAGIAFDTQTLSPRVLSDSKLSTLEGCATISTPQGNLLFYTDGVSIWNNKHNIINPNTNMLGHYSSTQSAVIVRKPGMGSLYYIFTTDAAEYINPPNDGLHYTIVDVAANDSNMSVVEINKFLHKPMTEKITYTYHKNGIDFWVIAHESKTNNFYAYLLTSDGIADTVISSVGSVHDADFINSIGYMKVSPRHDKLALSVFAENLDSAFTEVFKFDNETGAIYDPIRIEQYRKRPYGIEFSQNGKYLYVGETTNSISQYDLRDYQLNKILASRVQIDTKFEQGQLGALQLAPDGKIYIVAKDRKMLSAIRKPNLKGNYCDYNRDEISLTTGTCTSGLPQFIPPYPNYLNINPCYGSAFSLIGDDILEDTLKYPYTLEWTSTKGFQSNNPKPKFDFADSTLTDVYKLTIIYNVSGRDSIAIFYNYVTVRAKPSFALVATDTICFGNKTRISVMPNVIGRKYLWSNGATSSSTEVGTEGWYWVKVISEFGCIDSSAKYISILPETKAEIIGSNSFCSGEYTELFSEFTDKSFSYLWSTGETTSSIKASKDGNYWLKILNSEGCFDSVAIKVYEFKSINVKIKGDSVICGNYESTLSAEPIPNYPDADYTYEWNNNSFTKDIKTNQTGRYIVKISVNGQCFAYDTLELIKYDMPKIKLNKIDTVLACEGEIITLDIIDYKQDLNYRWNTGSINKIIEVSKTGKYTAKVTNKGFCEDSASVFVIFNDKPKVEIFSDGIYAICKNQSIVLRSKYINDSYNYQWSDGSIHDSIIVSKAGRYTLVINNGNCIDSVSVNIIVTDNLPVVIAGKTSICGNEYAEISAYVNSAFPGTKFEYLWNTGDTTESIIVQNTGMYFVKVKQKDGCEGYDTIYVNKYKQHTPELNKSIWTICEGDSVEIFDINFDYNFIYKWNDGFDGYKRKIFKAGTYILNVSDNGFCINYDTVKIEVIEVPLADIEIIGSNVLCNGNSSILKIKNYSNEFEYSWSTGEVAEQISVSDAGRYFLYAKNKLACADTTFVDIYSSNSLDLKILTDNDTLCANENAKLSLNHKFKRYVWSNGDTISEIKVTNPGKYSVICYDSLSCDYFAEINIYAYDINFEINNNLIDFGEICQYDKYTNKFTIKNNSDYNLEYKIANNKNTDFSYTYSNNKLLKNSTFEINVDYLPNNYGIQTDTITLEITEPCYYKFDFYVNAEFLKSVDIKTTENVGYEGDTICVPVTIRDYCSTNNKDIKYIDVKLRIFSDVALPLFLKDTKSEIISNKLVNGFREIIIRINDFALSSNDEILFDLCYYLLAGGKDSTSIDITQLNYENREIIANTTNGSIKIVGCATDLKKFQSYNPTKIIVDDISKNTLEFEIETQESGNFTIKIFNINSTKVFEQIINKSNNNLENIHISEELLNLTSGLYYIIVQTNNSVYYRKTLLVK